MTVPVDVRFVAADAPHQHDGLLGWAQATIDSLAVDGFTLHRTLRGRLVVTWPHRRGEDGRLYPVVEPVDAATRQAVRAAVVAAWRTSGGTSP